MKWKKLGLVYCPDGKMSWAVSHAMVPTPLLIGKDLIRVYITCCDEDGVGRPGYVDLSAKDPTKVLDFSKRSILDVGRPGTFDENGVLCCSIVKISKSKIFMYYVGFELGKKIRYRLLTGLAISTDGGVTFSRYQETPILERSPEELFFRGGPCCVKEGDVYKMWYVAGSSWELIEGKSMPIYEVKFIESRDGINWPPAGATVLPIQNSDEHGFGRPYVIKSSDTSDYQMFYSIRRRSLLNYRLGYAESRNGLDWVRDDQSLNLDVSPGGFDSDGIMYASPIYVGDKLFAFYNGNNFGRDGFGVAVLEAE